MSESGYVESPVGLITEVGWPSEELKLLRSFRGNAEYHHTFSNSFGAPTGNPEKYTTRIMTGAVGGAEWDWRLIPQGTTGQDVTAQVNFAMALANGPYYLETGAIVTPADRPCVACFALNPTSGPNVSPYAPGVPRGLRTLSSYTQSDEEIGLTVSPGHAGGLVTLNVRCTQFSALNETITSSYAASATETTIAAGVAADINTQSSILAATDAGSVTGSGKITITVTNFSTPGTVTSQSMSTGFITRSETNVVASSAPTSGYANLEVVTFELPPT